MINESEIFATKLLKGVYEIGKNIGITEDDVAAVAALLVGLLCLYDRWDERNEEPDSYVHREIKRLYNVNRHQNRDDIGQVFFETLGAVSEFVGSKEKVSLPARLPEFIFEVTDLVRGLTNGTSRSTLELVFTEVFRRVAGVSQEREFHNSRRLAKLTNSLNVDSRPIWEYFMYFGDLSVESTYHRQSIAYGSVIPKHELLLRIRLRIAGISLQPIGPGKLPEQALLFINHSAYATTTRADMQQREFRYNSSLSALANLWSHNDVRQAIVVVPGADRSAGGARGELREELVNRGAVKAVIDIPLKGAKGERAIPASVWVLGKRSSNTEDILFMDATKLPKREFSFDRDSGTAEDMRFIGAIINDWLGIKSISSTIAEFDSNSLAGLVSQYFKNGYRDVTGLCRVIPSSAVRERRYNLSANAYLQMTEAPMALSTIDSSAIVSMLDSTNSTNFRAYVIGNNGTGKSLLLRELVHILDQKQIRSIGIAFGITDRFPLQPKSPKNSMFVYRGARTGPTTHNLSTSISALSRLTKQIHVDQPRLDAFSQTMTMLGFDRRHYLVPQHHSSIAALDDDQLAEIIQLTESAQENERMFAKLSVRQHQLGLMRREESGKIVLFDALSSGEQQVLTLAIKLIAEANPGTVMLVDEPEISMHVAWQRVLPTVLEHISTNLGCSMVIATHSPVLIASATSSSDYRFVARRGTLTSLPIQRAQSVDTVLFDDFETYTENNRRVHERCARTVSEVIGYLNSEDDDRMSKAEQARAELTKMRQIIRGSAHAVSRTQLTADLDLIRKADSAIAEIIRAATEETAQEEDSE
jgi:ABC-type Mn2+/Zn2+ transport system ATPase subunit